MCVCVCVCVCVCIDWTVNWLDHSRTFREQGVEESETLLLRRKFFYSDQNVDSRDPVQLNLLYVQVNQLHTPFLRWCSKKTQGGGMAYCTHSVHAVPVLDVCTVRIFLL